MTTETLTYSVSASTGRFFGRVGSMFAAISKAAAAHMTMQHRLDEVQRLQSLSDADLAQRGIPREKIVHHVFRDYLQL